MADPVSLAITVAVNVAAMAMTMMNKIEGPRLDDLTVTTADYGTPLVQFYGTRRLEAPVIYAEGIREEKHKSKGKTGKYAEYKYFGTWACLVADHEINDVLKIYFDRRLLYDKTKTGPIGFIGFLEHSGDDLKIGVNCRIYLGTETQSPDPRMLAKIEAKEGVGRCPAYLGVAYVMFEEIPLEHSGNRMPQVSVEALRAPPANPHPYEQHACTNALDGVRFSPDFRKMLVASGSQVDLWDVANRSLVYSGVLDAFASTPIGVLNDGSFYTVVGSPGHPELYLESPYGGAARVTDIFDFIPGGVHAMRDGTLYFEMFGQISDGYGVIGSHGVTAVPLDYVVTHFTEDADGGTIFFGWDRNLSGPLASQNTIVINGNHIASPTTGGCSGLDNGNGSWIVLQDTSLHLIDQETLTITRTVDTSLSFRNFDVQRDAMANMLPGFRTIWIINKEYDALTLDLIREVDLGDWVAENASQTIYDPINHALISTPFFGESLTWRFLDRQDAVGYPLGGILEDAALQAGMRAGEYDFSLLDQIVPGFSWTQGPAKDVVGALLEIYDSDVRATDWVEQGLKRGQLLAGPPLVPEWMVPDQQGGDDGRNPLYSIRIASETDLPRRVFATFADPNMEEQPNTAIVQRNAASVETNREMSFDLGTLKIDPSDIQPLLERALRRFWVGSTRPQFLLSPLEIRIEPGDVRHIFLDDGEVLRCKNTRTVIRANRVLDTEWEVDGEVQAVLPEWELDDASPLSQTYNSPGGFTQGRPEDEILFPQETKGFMLDVGLLTDADDSSAPFLYIAASPQFEFGFWPGSGVWSADTNDLEAFEAGFDTFPSDNQVTWGVMVGTLPDAATDVIDYASEVEVVLPAGGELESVTEDVALADQTVNMAVIGQEIVQFLTAVLVDTNRYRLSGFIRGMRGSEWAAGDHGTAESFVLVDANVKKHIVGASEIGDTDYYKFSTLGDNIAAVETIEVAFAAEAHRPLSPCHLTLQRQPDNDWLITWQRRTRIGGSTVNGQDVPLGETSELYRVKIMDGSTVLKTYEATEEQYLYTEAEQILDWGFSPSTLVAAVVQVSPVLNLEGHAAGPVDSSANPHSGTPAGDVSGPEGFTAASGDITLPLYDVDDVVFIHIAHVSFGGTTPDNTPPTGWELVHSQAANPYQIVYAREMDGTEDPTVHVVWNGQAVNRQVIATAFAVRGAQAGLTYEGQTSNSGSAGGTGTIPMVSPAITTLGATRRLFNFLAAARGTSDTQAGSADTWTDIFDSGTFTLSSLHLDAAASYKDVAGAGVQGTETRQEDDAGSGLFWTYVSFALMMA